MKSAQVLKRMLSVVKLTMVVLILSICVFGGQLPDQALNSASPRIREIMNAQEEATPELMAIEDVIGTAIGQDDDGEPTILVFVNLEGKNPSANSRKIPKAIKGERVTVSITEPFRAFAGKNSPTTTVSHTAKQALPIKLGTSGGWRNDLANGYCCGGTLGALIQVNGQQYILSNYHVFEADIVPGGNGVVATNGSYAIQPGLIDVGCGAPSAQNVATLQILKSLPNSNVDASIAQVLSGAVSAEILEIGPISSQTVPAALNQKVKKSGRTTGLTRSSVSGLNATISVTYENECAGGTAFTKIFTGQIVLANRSSRFLNSGDSGSLLVEDYTTNPRAIGLLFAGSSSLAIANPINQVLAFVGNALGGSATMVGN